MSMDGNTFIALLLSRESGSPQLTGVLVADRSHSSDAGIQLDSTAGLALRGWSHKGHREPEPGGTPQGGDAPAGLNRGADFADVLAESRDRGLKVRSDQRDSPKERRPVGSAGLRDCLFWLLDDLEDYVPKAEEGLARGAGRGRLLAYTPQVEPGTLQQGSGALEHGSEHDDMIDPGDTVRVHDRVFRRGAIRDGRPQAVKIGPSDIPQRPGDQAFSGVAAREVQPHVSELADSAVDLEARGGPGPGLVSDGQLVDRRKLDSYLRRVPAPGLSRPRTRN